MLGRVDKRKSIVKGYMKATTRIHQVKELFVESHARHHDMTGESNSFDMIEFDIR